MADSRERLIELVQRIMDADYATEEEHDRAIAEFEAAVLHPRATSLIYYPHQEGFDHEPTAEEVVDRALSYRPIQL